MLFTKDAVFVGTDDGEGHVYAFDLATGKVRWKFRADRGVGTDIVRHASRLFAVSIEDRLLCLELETGLLLWEKRAEADASERLSLGSTPAVGDGTVYFGSVTGTLSAQDIETGETRWETPLGSEVVTSVLLLEDAILAGTEDARIHRADPATGKLERSIDVPEKARGHLVVTPVGSIAAFLGWENDLLVSFDPSLNLQWSSSPPDGSGWSTARPFVLGPWILAGTRAGMIYAVDAAQGTVAWAHDVDPERDWSEDAVRVFGAHDATLFVGTISGTLYAFRMGERTE